MGYPFGAMRYPSGTTPTPTTFRFTGQRLEVGLAGTHGLYFYNARWYDPALGRFVSPDTIVPDPANPQSLNRYSYVLNNPVKYTDPTGYVMACDWDINCGGMGLRRIFDTIPEADRQQEALRAFFKTYPEYNLMGDQTISGDAILPFLASVAQLQALSEIVAAKPDVSTRYEEVKDKLLPVAGELTLFGLAIGGITILDVPTLGGPGKRPNVREMQGTVSDARQLFDELSAGAINVEQKWGGVTVATMPDGSQITFRPRSSWKSRFVPTVDVNAPSIGYWKVKFKP